MDRRIRKERLLSKLIRMPVTYVVLVIFFLLFSYSAIATHQKSRLAKQKTRQVEYELDQLVQQEESLTASLNDMNTPFGIEKSLREKFGIIKEGEKSVIIVDPPEETPSGDTEEKKGIFNFFRNIF